MSPRPLVVTNWKMNPARYSEAVDLATSIVGNVACDAPEVDIVLCPPYPWLFPVYEVLKNKSHRFKEPAPNLYLGAQNIHYEANGAYTGEVSAAMLRGIAKYVIVGHSERVRYFGETRAMTSKKVSIALDNELIPIICIGEEKRTAKPRAAVAKQLRGIISNANITNVKDSDFVIAYEPLWAISTMPGSEPATGGYAQRVAKGIREIVGNGKRILYGGSVNEENIGEFLRQDDIDGVLVGSASLDEEKFAAICRTARNRDKLKRSQASGSY